MKKRYNDIKKQAAHENACDCLYYGYGKSVWNSCDLDEETANLIWKTAKEVIANGNRY